MRVLVYGMVGENRGGIETFLLNMNEHMGTDVIFDYVIEEEKCIHEEKIRNRGGNIYYITKRTKNPIKNLRDNLKLLDEVKDKVEAVYFNLSSLSWIEPICFSVKKGFRTYVHAHNAQYIEANSSVVHKVLNSINRKRIKKLNITRLTCSKPATEFMFEESKPVYMINNAIDIKKFFFDENVRNKVRGELGLENALVMGFVGRINDQKNPLYLVKILRNMVNKNDRVKLMILGEGRLMDSLKEEMSKAGLEQYCLYMGNRTNVNEYMQAMDVLLLPSLHEGLPYVVVEAQTAGLPCFVSEHVTREVDITNNVSFLELTEDALNWEQAITKKITSKMDERYCYAKKVDESGFNIEKSAENLENILKGNF